MRRASSTVQSTAKVSRPVSNKCSLRRCAPATSLSWITSARTKAARSAAPFALLALISCFCRCTRPTSIRSSRSSQNSSTSQKSRRAHRRWPLAAHRRSPRHLHSRRMRQLSPKRRICFYLNPKGSSPARCLASALVGVLTIGGLATRSVAQESHFNNLANLPFAEGRQSPSGRGRRVWQTYWLCD